LECTADVFELMSQVPCSQSAALTLPSDDVILMQINGSVVFFPNSVDVNLFQKVVAAFEFLEINYYVVLVILVHKGFRNFFL